MSVNFRVPGWLLLGLLITATAQPADPPASFDGSMTFNLEHGPIRYAQQDRANPIAQLKDKLQRGEVKLPYDQDLGYLPGLLAALKVPTSSQSLVFSKTSFQAPLILPSAPRAIYFNDDVYVGYVRGGDYVELSVADAELGAVFYVLEQAPTSRPKLIRRDDCLQCHQTGRTAGVPGHVVRSVHVQASGHIHTSLGSFITDHRSPYSERFGGWYVTGQSGPMRHMGNQTVEDPNQLDPAKGANLSELPTKVNPNDYLTPTSDIVAQMVLQHQTTGHNYLARLNYETRGALVEQQALLKMDGKVEGEWIPSIQRRIHNAVEATARYLTMADEAPLPGPVRGSAKFAADFQGSKTKSLRALDLQTRLFRYPLSFLVESPAVAALDPRVRAVLQTRLATILNESDKLPGYSQLNPTLARDAWKIYLANNCVEPALLSSTYFQGARACSSSR